MQKTYYQAIDYIKLVFALLVIGVHTGPFLSINETMNFVYVQILGRMAVPFFFIASAYFLFKKMNLSISMSEKENKKILKGYLWRIARLYLVWSLIYFVFVLYGWIQDGFHIVSIIRYVRDFIFIGSYYHLWFLPAMIVSTWLVCFLKDKIKTKTLCILAFTFYLIGMAVNVYGDVLSTIPMVSQIMKGYLQIFETTRNGVFFGFIYTVMGYLLAIQKQPISKNASLIGMLIFFGCFVLEACLLKQANLMNDLTSMYFMLLPLEYALMSYLLQFPSNHATSIIIREMSTLIYVMHIIFCILYSYVPFLVSHSLLYYGAVCITSMIVAYGIIRISKSVAILRKLY